MSGQTTNQRLWLTSFVDLTGLLLTIFVLLYSMSDDEHSSRVRYLAAFLNRGDLERTGQDFENDAARSSDPETEISIHSKRVAVAQLRHIVAESNGQLDFRIDEDWLYVKGRAEDNGINQLSRNFLQALTVIRTHAVEIHLIAPSFSDIETTVGADAALLRFFAIRQQPELAAGHFLIAFR